MDLTTILRAVSKIEGLKAQESEEESLKVSE